MITYAEAKSFLELPDDSDQTQVETLIGYAESVVEDYCDRVFDSTAYTNEVLERESFDLIEPNQLFNRTNKYRIYFTKQYPIVDGSVTITYKGNTVNSDKYFVDNSTGEIRIDQAYFDYEQDLLIDYTAGYSTIPGSLKLVVLELVSALYGDRGEVKKGSSNVKSKSVGEFSVTYDDSTETQQIIDSYRITLDKYSRVE